jgi:hypothetical protein
MLLLLLLLLIMMMPCCGMTACGLLLRSGVRRSETRFKNSGIMV